MNGQFLGFLDLGDTLRLWVQCRNASSVDTAPTSAPTYSIYAGSDTAIITGSLGSSDADSKTGFRTGDLVCSGANGFASGVLYRARISYAISGSNYSVVHTFFVN